MSEIVLNKDELFELLDYALLFKANKFNIPNGAYKYRLEIEGQEKIKLILTPAPMPVSPERGQ